MQNIEMTVEGNTLTIKVDLTKRLGLSQSKKTTLVASTGPAVDIPDHPGMKLGLNIYTK